MRDILSDKEGYQAMPTFVGKTDAKGTGVSTLTLTRTTAAGNALLVGVVLTDGTFGVAAIVDSQGNDANGVPINRWSKLGDATNKGIRYEWWICKGSLSVTSVVVDLAGPQNAIAVLIEDSGANGVTTPQFQAVESSQNIHPNLHIQESVATFPNSGSEIMIGLFATLDDDFGTAIEGTSRSGQALSIPPDLSYQVLEQGTVDASGLLTITAQTTTLATSGNVSGSVLGCFWLLVSGGLILNSQPGFNDQSDAVLAAQRFSLGVELAKISSNAAFGMVRTEFFQGVYSHGQTVDLPVSSVDGYSYSRDELIYSWAVYSSLNPSNGWITGPTALWYSGWNVDQNTGAVTCEEWYRNDAQSAVSNDGFIQVFIIAQRQKKNLVMALPPQWSEIPISRFALDKPQDTETMVALNNNSKFSVLGFEAIYMGEFYDGQTVPMPVSPADGWQYSVGEVSFVHSFRWTCDQTKYTAPGWDTDWSFDGMYADITSGGAVSCAVIWGGRGGEGSSVSSSDGRISVVALCRRAPRWFISEYSRPWNNLNSLNPSKPYTDGTSTVIGGMGGPLYGMTRIPVTEGNTYSLKYISGFVHNNAGISGGLNGPDGLGGESDAFNGGDGTTYTGSAQLAFSGLGCYADDNGTIVGTPFHFGNGTTSLTVPTGATHIQLGVDNGNSSNLGNDGSGWWISLSQNSTTLANQFAEIDNSVFYPGELLPASIQKQIFQNTLQANLSPEIFGPTDYGDTDTIPTPTSPVDGYVYKRAELTYIWNWKYMTPGPFSYPPSSHNLRVAAFSATINQSTGAVAMSLWRLVPGGPYVNYPSGDSNIADDLITVWVIGFRAQQQTAVTVPVTDNAPADATTTATDSTTVTITVNGT